MKNIFKKKDSQSENKDFKIGGKNNKRIMVAVRVFSIIATSVLLIVSILILESLLSMGILPAKYLIIVIAFLCILLAIGVLMFFLAKKHKIIPIVFGVVYLIISGFMCWGAGYLYRTRSFFSQTTAKDHYVVNYSVLVSKESPYQELAELAGKRYASYIDTIPSYNDAFEKLKEQLLFNTIIKDTYAEAARAVLNNEADFVLLSESYLAILEDLEEGISERFRSIYNIEIKIYDTVEVADVNVTEEPFNIFISGIDTEGDISNVSRSDVNMIVSVNPKTHKILLGLSIPRDFYVQLHGTTGIKDKLTHSGIYGPKMTVKTVEDLLGININYFIRVNFSSVVNLVDAIGGIYLTPDMSFARDTMMKNQPNAMCYYYQDTRNWYDGVCALRYARERKAYGTGDLHRNQNQQQVLTAIIDKISSAEIIRNYSNILSAIEGNFETSIPEKKFYQLINNQLDNMPRWSVENSYLEGHDAYTNDIYSNSMDGAGTNNAFYYVMEPNEGTVENAKAKIDAIFANE